MRMWISAVAVALAVSCGGAGGATVGGRTADFALEDIDGQWVRLSDHLGKDVILVNFWATWCGPCGQELPHLQRLYDDYRAEGFVVLAVSMDGPDTIAAVAPRARREGLTFPVLLDTETRVVGMLNPSRAAPFSVLIGRDGRVVSVHEGYSAGDERHLEAAVRAQL